MPSYCEDYPCCGHTRLDPCPNEDGTPTPVVMTRDEFQEAYYCDQCGTSHYGPCPDTIFEEEDDEDVDGE